MFKFLLIAISIITLLIGFIIAGEAKSSIHEILGILFFVISAICLSGYGIIAQIEKQNKINNSRKIRSEIKKGS